MNVARCLVWLRRTPLALFAAGVWGACAALRRRLYDAYPQLAWRADVPVISIGALEAGGTGKSPIVAWLLADLLACGHRPGLLTRGYGRQARGLQTRAPAEPAQAQRLGDEPAMMVAGGLDVAIAACAKRVHGAQALQQAGVDVLVMDDGFVHRQLRRDFDIVVLRGEAPLADGCYLPWGNLREGPAALGRAHLIWLHYRAGPAPKQPAPKVQQMLQAYAPGVPVVLSEMAPAAPDSCATDAHGRRQPLMGQAILAAAGIARPEEFRRDLLRAKAVLRGWQPMADHAAWPARQCQALARKAEGLGVTAVVVTSKDWVKLAPQWRSQVPLWQLGQQLRLAAGGEPAKALWRAAAADVRP